MKVYTSLDMDLQRAANRAVFDGLAAYGDRASPRRAQGKQQGQAESDHGREAADDSELLKSAPHDRVVGHAERRPGDGGDGTTVANVGESVPYNLSIVNGVRRSPM